MDCPICLSDHVESGRLIVTNCNHTFCASCILSLWNYHLRRPLLCPCCRTGVRALELHVKDVSRAPQRGVTRGGADGNVGGSRGGGEGATAASATAASCATASPASATSAAASAAAVAAASATAHADSSLTTRAAAAKTRAQIAAFNRYYSSTNLHGSMAGWGPNPLDKLWDTYVNVAPRDPPVLQVRRFCDDLRHRRCMATLAAVVLAGAAVVLVMAFAEQLSSPHSALGVTHQSTTPY